MRRVGRGGARWGRVGWGGFVREGWLVLSKATFFPRKSHVKSLLSLHPLSTVLKIWLLKNNFFVNADGVGWGGVGLGGVRCV